MLSFLHTFHNLQYFLNLSKRIAPSMPRLFTGIKIPSSICDQLTLIQYGLLGARWIEPHDFHITLRFIGDVDDDLANDLADGFTQISTAPFSLQLKSVGVFGNDRPRMIWAGVEKSSALEQLHSSHEIMAQRLGLKAEGRKFIPHVTLARFKPGQTSDVGTYLIDHSRFQSLEFEVSSFELYSAKASRGGGPYIIEQSYELLD